MRRKCFGQQIHQVKEETYPCGDCDAHAWQVLPDRVTLIPPVYSFPNWVDLQPGEVQGFQLYNNNKAQDFENMHERIFPCVREGRKREITCNPYIELHDTVVPFTITILSDSFSN